MDILGANFYGAVEQIRTRLGKNAICLQLPIGKEDEFKGIIDLFEMKAYIYNDDKGDNITVTDDLGDMKDDRHSPFYRPAVKHGIFPPLYSNFIFTGFFKYKFPLKNSSSE